MPSFCVVSNCELKYTHSENVSFHKFPLHDESLLHKWITFTDRGVDWKPSRWSSICSRHFSSNDFREFLSRKCLKKYAVPSVVTKSNISYETYHIADQSSTANSQCGDDDLSECNDGKENEPTTDAEQSEGDKLRVICCRLCGDRIVESVKTGFNFRIDDQEIGEMIRKCLPSISISRHTTDHWNLICHVCVSQLRGHSEFVDKVLIFQRDFGHVNNTDTSLEQMIFESRGNNNSSTSNSALFIKQEPINVKQEIFDSSNKKPQEAINVMRPFIVPSTSTIAETAPDTIDQCLNVVEPTLIHLPRTYANTFCRLCERFFINNAEMQAHACGGSQPPAVDRYEAINSTINNNNCEIMEIITLNNPVSFIDLAEDECVTAEQTTVCKKENVIDVPRERVDIEHAYAKRTTITTASNTCKLKQEIEINYDCDSNEEDFVLDAASNNDTTAMSIPYSVDPTQENFICSKCGQEFNTNHSLDDHSSKMHSLKNRICPICLAEFKSTYEFLLHKNKVHVSGGFRCQQCKRKFTTRFALRNHERHSCSIDSVDFYYSCRYCGKFMRNRIKMKEHLKICGENLKGRVKRLSSTDVNTTRNYDEIASSKIFNCFRCPRTFRKEINLKRHLDNQCGRKNPKTTSEPSATSGPTVEVTDGYSSSPISNTETDNAGLIKHTVIAEPLNNNINNNNKPCGRYVCEIDVCRKSFHAYANLKQHKTTHENEKRFICVLCPKKFKRISGLNQHVRGFHYKIKPFSCPICSYTYALKGDMLRCRHSSLKKDVTAVNTN